MVEQERRAARRSRFAKAVAIAFGSWIVGGGMAGMPEWMTVVYLPGSFLIAFFDGRSRAAVARHTSARHWVSSRGCHDCGGPIRL
jgi:hypothetical protein